MLRQIHQLLSFEKSGFDELIWIWPNAICFVSDKLRLKQVDPLAIAGRRHTVRYGAVHGVHGRITHEPRANAGVALPRFAGVAQDNLR